MSRGKKKSKKRSNVDPGRKICDDGARSDLRKNEVPARTEAVLLAATVDELARIAADLHLAAKAQAYKHPMVLVMDEGASARDPLIGVVTSISQASLQFRLHRCRTRLIGLHPPRGVGGAASVSPLLYWLIAEGQFFVRVLQMEEQYRALLETIKDKGTEDVLVCSYVAREKVMTITYLLSDVLEWEPCLGLEDVMVLKERTGEVKSYFDTGEAGPRPAGQSSAMVPAPAPSSADGTCASCGVRAVRFMYYPAPVSCYVSFDRASSVSAATDKDSGDVFVSFQAGGVVRPDIVAQVGDLHCYWRGEPPPNFTPVGFCQRACATRYAEQRGVLLITDSRVITPQSSAFDAFAKSHKLTKSLSINREDDWQTEYQELTALLESPPCLPDHLITLCGLVYQKGHKSLAERAIDSILARFPLHKVIDRLIPVLAQMGQVSRIDELYEQMLLMRDRHEDLGWQRLTNWAFAIVGHRPAKAKVLSKIALALSGQDSLVVCNHLNVLQVNGSLDEAVSFLEGHAHLLRTHAGNFAAGQVYLKAERPAEALDHLLVAKEALDEPLTERYLAEAYLALGRLPEAQAAISAALACLESYRGRLTTTRQDIS